MVTAATAFLSDAQPDHEQCLFHSKETMSPADLKKKFLDSCREQKLAYCIVVREMDNPTHQFVAPG